MILRRSGVSFAVDPIASERREHWEVVLEYEKQGMGPHLVDLSHCSRWELQDADLAASEIADLSIPPVPGASRLDGDVLVNRMNRTRAAVWHLCGRPVELPDLSAFTDVTDATVFLALIGPRLLAVAEKLSNLDLARTDRAPPFLIQGPFSHVPCQIVVLERSTRRSGLLLTCSRGHARDMVDAILHAGETEGLRPAGENAFKERLALLRR